MRTLPLVLLPLIMGSGSALERRPVRTPLHKCRAVPRVDRKMLSRLHTTALNRVINSGYSRLAECFQAIAEGNPARGASFGKTLPVWYAFAPYASRVVGGSEHALQALLDSLPTSVGSAVWRFLRNPVGGIRDAATFIPRLVSAMHTGVRSANVKAFLSARVLAKSAACVTKVLWSSTGHGVIAKARSVGRTLLNFLEDGNRRIFSDIGGAGARYLRWRRRRAFVTPTAVLSRFSKLVGGHSRRARIAYNYARQVLAKGKGALSLERNLFRRYRVSCKDAKPASFALYELAGRSIASARPKLIDAANTLLAYCEQHDVVQPAFAPAKVLEGEVDRATLLSCLTPTVQLPVRSARWSLVDYCKRNKLDVTRLNWARFSERWAPILDAFQAAYRAPTAPWPMPNPDASKKP